MRGNPMSNSAANSSSFNNVLIKLEQGLTLFLLSAIVLLVFSAAVMRSFGLPIIWSVDIAQLFFAWLCMLGANQALRKSEHVGVDMLVRRFSWQVRVKLDLVLYSFIFIGLFALLVFGAQLTLLNPQRALGTTPLSYSLVTLALPVGALLMLNTITRQWLGLFRLLGKDLDHIDFSATYLPPYILSQEKLTTQRNIQEPSK